jgi:hypothetical protein
MKISRICALALIVVAASAMAFADGINDPKIIVHGVNGSGNTMCGKHQCQDVGINFTATVPKSGSGVLYFTNVSGKNWTSLTLVETGVPAADISCVQTFFLSCTTKTEKNGSVEIIMSGVRGGLNPRKGIGNGQSFSMQFECNGGCWPGGLQIGGHAGTTPEPATVALMVTGLGAMFSRRKFWKNRFNA